MRIAFVAALSMDPMQIRIGDVIARSSDSRPVRSAEKDGRYAEDCVCGGRKYLYRAYYKRGFK